MVTIECPWCDQPVALEDGDTVHCDGCQVELSFAPDQPIGDVALAA
jgi:hypothetical protein